MLVLTKNEYEIEEEIVLKDKEKELYRFTMKITPDEMQEIKEMLFSEETQSLQKQIEKLKREGNYKEAEKLENELGTKIVLLNDKLLKIWFKNDLEPFKEIAGTYKFNEMVNEITGFFINAFVKKQIAPLNTTITDLQKISLK
jgi:hypothetical protein